MLNPIQKAAQDQFEKQSHRYGKSHILSDTSDVKRGLEGCDFPAQVVALDVATGGGHTAVFLARRGFSVTAADLSPAMLEGAGSLAREEGLRLELVCHPAEEFPYSETEFDLVTCRVAAHHFSDVEAFLRECFRVLKPGGYLLIIDGSVPDGEAVAADWLHQVEKLRDPSHGRFISPEEWRAVSEEAGLTILGCESTPFKQPDLEWYFQTADTSPSNCEAVRKLVREAPEAARRVFSLDMEDGKITWWWSRMSLLMQKVVLSDAS